jgi:hypothetical protein
MPGKTYAAVAVATNPVSTTPKDPIETSADKSDVVTVTTTEQRIMTGLNPAETDDDPFALIMSSVSVIVMKK